AGMPPAQGQQRLDQIGIPRLRTLMRAPRVIAQTIQAFGLVALEPLIARLATDAVLGGELGHRKQLGLILANEFQALLHGRRLAPRHRGTSTVLAAPARAKECYLCRWTEVLSMSPDCASLVPNP